MKISEREDYLKDNPDFEQVPASQITLVSGVMLGTSMKPSESFREVLRHIKKNNINSNINTF